MLNKYKKLIAEACTRVYEVAKKTTLDYAPELSLRHKNTIWLKREDQQPVFSYKLRGAYNLMATLTEKERQQGVITASAGNHAQGVALAAQKLGVNALIVMPKTTPEIKITSVKRLDANVVLHGNTYDEAKDYAIELAGEKTMTYVPPYDHPVVIAGQATVGVEILDQHPGPIDIIFVPVGGGGLIAGIAVYAKERNPMIKIIGVESDEAPCMYHALEAGERIVLERIGIFADGAAVRQVGEEPFQIAQMFVDEVLLVTNDEVCAAVQDIFEDTRSIPEPAGALALAGLKQYVKREKITNKDLVAIFSGANVNFDRLRHIAELSALGEHREALIATTIPERPGSFRAFCHDLGPRLITEFNYRYADTKEAHVFAGIQLRHGIEEKNALIQHLTEKGYKVVDLSNDEVAKMHVRYMVGGHASHAVNERLYRFEFPERSGALLHFLTQMGERWNISLFHYRNHGAAYGRVLMGIQVSDKERAEFQKFLDGLEMQYWEENNNPAYKMFLS
ncbi:MAG: threonine ammonia-lyase, biosynthetic [Gammaproteobacteria bacterium]|nr:threonine ammonia-lyase, biosynthetic [Gammaproteobacteria bacterium]